MTKELVLPGQGVLDLDRVETDVTVTYRIVLPYLPPSKNAIAGWPQMWQAGAKKKWARHIAQRCEELRIPLGCQRIGLAARLVFATRVRRDPQNYANQLWHWVPDALVKCGVLVDDDYGRISWAPNLSVTMVVDPRRGIPAKKKERTVLTVAVERAVRIHRR